MKKTIIALMGLFTLVACSDEAYLDSKDPNSNFGDTSVSSNPGDKRANTFDNDDSGSFDFGTGLITPPGLYSSPWDVWLRDEVKPFFIFRNEGGPGHSSPFIVKFYPWVGLAFYDGTNDGHYHDDYKVINNPPGLAANFTGGGYPNLYANNQEVGNLVRGLPMILDGTDLNNSYAVVATNTGQLPISVANLATWANNPLNLFFNLNNIPVAERNLLRDYGKVFYYEVEVLERTSGNLVLKKFIEVPVNSLTSSGSHWQPLSPLKANVPGGGGAKDMHYYRDFTLSPSGTVWLGPNNTSNQCDSREVIIETHYNEKEVFGYGSIQYKIETTMLYGVDLWRTGGLYVGLSLN